MANNRTNTSGISEHRIHFSSFDGLVLEGTLCVPNHQVKGVILMLVGSGIIDQDELISAKLTYSGKQEKLFKQLAYRLGRSGFATLRYNKRGVIQRSTKTTINKKIWEGAGRTALIKDAKSAARYLLKNFKIKAQDLILLGHSEGTSIAVETAISIGGKVKGLVFLGVVSRSWRELAYFQNVDLRLIENPTLKRNALEREMNRQLKPILNAKKGIGPDRKPNIWLSESLRAPANRERIKKTKCPIGVFHGKLDQSTPFEEADEIKNSYPNRVSLYCYPRLGHGFSSPKDGKQTLGPISSKVLRDVKDFCLKIASS